MNKKSMTLSKMTWITKIEIGSSWFLNITNIKNFLNYGYSWITQTPIPDVGIFGLNDEGFGARRWNGLAWGGW